MFEDSMREADREAAEITRKCVEENKVHGAAAKANMDRRLAEIEQKMAEKNKELNEKRVAKKKESDAGRSSKS